MDKRQYCLDDAPDNYSGDEAMAYVNGANFGYECGKLDHNDEITSLREQLEIAKKDGEPVTEKYSLSDAIQLCEDLLNPNMFGYSVTAEVRNRAREVLGLKGRE